MINQHKRMAMGLHSATPATSSAHHYAKGGPVVVKSSGVMPAIKGQPMNPLTKAKMNNGVPGFKAGGKVKPGCKC